MMWWVKAGCSNVSDRAGKFVFTVEDGQPLEAGKASLVKIKITGTDGQDFTALVGQAGDQVNGIYEADYRDFNRETYVRGRETFDRTYAEFKEILIGSWWRDQAMQVKEARNGEAQTA